VHRLPLVDNGYLCHNAPPKGARTHVTTANPFIDKGVFAILVLRQKHTPVAYKRQYLSVLCGVIKTPYQTSQRKGK
jgi:hypothetical protein